jgi:hypothetical protein
MPNVVQSFRRPAEPAVAERVWTVQRGGRQIDCFVSSHGQSGDCQIFDEDWCIYRRRWTGRAEALADAEVQKQGLLREGWTLTTLRQQIG